MRHTKGDLKRFGFTMTELLIVIAVIVILVSILIPTVGKIQRRAKAASTQAFIAQLSSAIDAYYGDFHAYPGPFSNDQVFNGNPSGGGVQGGTVDPFGNTNVFSNGGSATLNPPAVIPPGFDTTSPRFSQITMSENLVLGLLGGLRLDMAANPPNLVYDPSQVGSGPLSLNAASPKRFNPYIEDASLSWHIGANGKTGAYQDETGTPAHDSVIPEFVDRFSDPLPILYLRAKVGAAGFAAPGAYTTANNPIITNGNTINFNGTTYLRVGQYDITQFEGYTANYTSSAPGAARDGATPPGTNSISIGTGKDLTQICTDGSGTMVSYHGPAYHGLRTININSTLSINAHAQNTEEKYFFPYDAYAYFQNPAMSTLNSPVARQKDAYILISAGEDRVYGTDDDITNFGSVAP